MSGEAQSFSPTALQPDRLFPIGLVDVKMIWHFDNLNVMMARFDLLLNRFWGYLWWRVEVTSQMTSHISCFVVDWARRPLELPFDFIFVQCLHLLCAIRSYGYHLRMVSSWICSNKLICSDQRISRNTFKWLQALLEISNANCRYWWSGYLYT